MLNRLFKFLAWLFLTFVVFATLAPISLRPGLTAKETVLTVFIERAGAFGLLGFLFSVGYPNERTFVCAVVFGSAVILELLQLIALGRHAGVLDAAEKLAGGGLGIVAALWLMTLIPALTARQRKE